MKYIVCHGLGENSAQWEPVLEQMPFRPDCPDLFHMVRGEPLTYELLYAGFEKYCDSLDEGINLCGLSLGGVLALDYASRHTEKTVSLILIGTPYTIPRAAFAFQDFFFRLMPEKSFESMGLTKKSAVSLMRSMKILDIPGMAGAVKCRTLILCGGRDGANRKGAESLHREIEGSRFSVIQKSGHQVNVDAPEQLADMINAFWT